MLSIGYEQRDIVEFVKVLRDHQVDVLVDVRLNAISRKRGFSKTALSEALSASGIGYQHERSLGNPKDNRDAFRRGDAAAVERYRRHLENGAAEALTKVSKQGREQRIALLCFERDHEQCHRRCIADAAARVTPGLSVQHI